MDDVVRRCLVERWAVENLPVRIFVVQE